MARSTAHGLTAVAAALVDKYPDISAVASLGAEARVQGKREMIGVAAGNNIGKSTVCDTLILANLPRDQSAPEESEQEARREPPPRAQAMLLQELLLETAPGMLQELEKVQGRTLRYEVNPDPCGQPRHLQEAFHCFDGYYKGDHSKYRHHHPVLLPIGNRYASTTQVQHRITYDEVVACRIVPYKIEELNKLAVTRLEKMFNMVRCADDDDEDDDEDDKEDKIERQIARRRQNDNNLRTNPEFKNLAGVFKKLTGHDVLEEQEDTERIFLEILEGLGAAGTLLREDIVTIMANVVGPAVCAGAQEDLSTDFWYVRQAILNPLKFLVGQEAAGMVDELSEEDLRDLEGLLIRHIDITVPIPILVSIVLVDMPGLGDTSAVVNFNIDKALSEVNHVLVIYDRSLDSAASILDCLYKSDFLARQLADREGHGSLILMRYPERSASVSVKDLWDGKLETEAKKSQANSAKLLRRTIKSTLAPTALTNEERKARIEAFINTRTHILSVCPTTFCSLGLALASDVCAELQQLKVELPGDPIHQQVVNELTRKTNMHKFLEVLAKVSSFRDLQSLDALAGEVTRILAALPAEGAAPAGAAAGAELAGALQGWISGKAKKISSLVDQMKTKEDVIKTMRESFTAALDGPLELLVQEYEGKKLSDGNIKSIAEQAISLLRESGADMNKLRRWCQTKKLKSKGIDVFGHIAPQLLTRASDTMAEQRTALLQAHSSLAVALSDLLDQQIKGIFSTELLAFLQEPARWQEQLVTRVEVELIRTATYGLVDQTNVFDQKIQDALLSNLCAKVTAAERQFPKNRQIKANRFYAPLQGAVEAGLLSFRDQLPGLLRAQLRTYVKYEIFEPLLQLIKSDKHQIIKMELGLNLRTPLAQQQARQPCFWRCIYRFLCAAHSMAVAGHVDMQDQAAQEAQRQALRADLLELQKLVAAAARVYRADPKVVASELQWRQSNTLAHEALQRARESQVRDLCSKKIKPVGIDSGIHDGAAFFVNFVAHGGAIDLPSSLPEGSQAELQGMFDVLAIHSLYCKDALIPSFAAGSALEAACMAMFGKGPRNQEQGMATLRNLVSFELESDLEALEADLKLVHNYSTAGAAAFLNELESQARWTSLLELKGLACAMEANFIVFTSQGSPGSSSGRKVAYYISPAPLPRATKHMLIGYPIVLCMRAEAGRVRPWFLPLFLDREKSAQAAAAAANGSSGGFPGAPGASGNGSGGLRGSAEDVCRTLALMADRAALSRTAHAVHASKRPRTSTG